MTLVIDADDDGKPDAIIPLKWVVALLTVGLLGCYPSLSQFL